MSIEEQIDHVLRDAETTDAMRWTPDPNATEDPTPIPALTIDLRAYATAPEQTRRLVDSAVADYVREIRSTLSPTT
jgi:hypothetical protein